MPEKIGLFLVVLATLCGCSMVKAGWVDNMKCRACVKLAPYAGNCHIKCDEINIFLRHAAKFAEMVHRHPGTVCWAARVCKSRLAIWMKRMIYMNWTVVCRSGDFVDFDSPQVTQAICFGTLCVLVW